MAEKNGSNTSNLTSGSWNTDFAGDGVPTVAMLDRILRHSIIASINGESLRLKDRRKAGVLGASSKIAKRWTVGADQCVSAEDCGGPPSC